MCDWRRIEEAPFEEGTAEDWVNAPTVQIPAHRGQSFRRIADSNPVIADSF
jgi:hypothetical protein